MSEKRNRRTGRWARLLGVAALALGAQAGMQHAAHAAGSYTVTSCSASSGAGSLAAGVTGGFTQIGFSCGALQAGGYVVPITSQQLINGTTISIDGTDNNQFDVTLQVANGVGEAFVVGTGGSLALSNLTLMGGAPAPTVPSPTPPSPRDQGGVELLGGGNPSFSATNVFFENLQNTSNLLSGGKAGYGGALYLDPTQGSVTATVANSSFVGNYATYGGAIGLNNNSTNVGTLRVTNTSFAGNSAVLFGGALDFGSAGMVTLANDTIDGNQTLLSGVYSLGGGYASGAKALTINNTIVANNTNGYTPYAVNGNCYGTLTSQGGTNLEFPGTACGFGISGTDPGLTFVTPAAVTATTPGQSANFGTAASPVLGLVTPYWKIASIGSPAVDAVPAGTCLDAAGTPLAIDQIGGVRPSGVTCDIGANEYQQLVARLVILCGTPQSANANTAFAQPLIVQAVDVNGIALNGQQLKYTVGSGINGAGGTLSGGSPPASGVTTLTGTTGQVTLPANCANANTKVQGAVSFTLTANGTPSIPGTSYPVTVTVVGPTQGTVTPVVFAETNLQLVAASCSLRIGFFSSLGSTNGSASTQFSVATGRLLGGRRTLINYMALRGSAGQLLAVPITSSVRCLLPYFYPSPPGTATTRLPLTVDFDATAVFSGVSGIAVPSTVHVTIRQDLGSSPPVQTVTITNLTGTTTYYAFSPSNYSVAPQSFRISAFIPT